jgi:predicted NBD/HSP70 family sugar kinase
MPTWENYPIRDFFQEAFPNADVWVDNDVNMMALGELRAGAGIGVDNFIFVKIGTGIGAGIICHGLVHRGSTGSAGDIGHIRVDPGGPVCHCGNVGCLEILAAGPAIAARAIEAARNGSSAILAGKLEANDGMLRSEDVGVAAREGDRIANEIIQSSGHMIGDVLAGAGELLQSKYDLCWWGRSQHWEPAIVVNTPGCIKPLDRPGDARPRDQLLADRPGRGGGRRDSSGTRSSVCRRGTR